MSGMRSKCRTRLSPRPTKLVLRIRSSRNVDWSALHAHPTHAFSGRQPEPKERGDRQEGTEPEAVPEQEGRSGRGCHLADVVEEQPLNVRARAGLAVNS